jgi:hypothetical protein
MNIFGKAKVKADIKRVNIFEQISDKTSAYKIISRIFDWL